MSITEFTGMLVTAMVVGGMIAFAIHQSNQTDPEKVYKRVYEENVKALPILNQLCDKGNHTACLRAIDVKHDIEDYLEQVEIDKALNQ